MLYLQLFWEFFKTGLFAIGGGMATLPFLYDMADKTGWFTRAQLADMIAVSESTPGPIGVNMATYVGFLTGGVPGAVTATVGLIAPSVIVILIVAAFLQAFRDSKYVAGAFYGLRPASTALITAAGLVVVRETFWLTSGVLFWQGIILAAVLLVLTRHLKEHFGDAVTVIGHDSYYKRQDGKTYEERSKVNYDHPDAFETSLLVEHLKALKAGRNIQCPVYSYVDHNRTDETVEVFPTKVIIVEGILIFQDPTLRDMFDIKIFVETDADVRILRRTLESVITQYLTTVKPMHE